MDLCTVIPATRRSDSVHGLYKQNINNHYSLSVLCAFAKLPKETSTFLMSVRLYVWNNSAPTRRITLFFIIKFVPFIRYNNIYLLQLGFYPVAVVILHVNKT